MNSTPRAGTVRLFGTALVDQVMLSAANFAVGLLLIRLTSDFDYGLYVLVQSAILLLTSAQGAWVSGPLSTLVPHKPPAEQRVFIGAVSGSQRRILRVLVPVALLLCFAGYGLRIYDALMAEVLACAVLAGWGALHRDYLRNLLLMLGKPAELLQTDVLYVVVLLAGVVWAAFGSHQAIVFTVMALAASAWASTALTHRSLARDPGWVQGDAAPAWRELRTMGLWALLAATLYWLFGQSYSYILATRLDLRAVADVNEARLLLTPMFIAAIGIQKILAPTAPRWFAQAGFHHLMKRVLWLLVITFVGDMLYFAVVWVFRGWLVGSLLHKHIHDRDELLLLWTAIGVIGLVREILQCCLTALGAYKSMAKQVALSAVVALVLMWFGTSWWGAAAVLIGQVAGELVNIAGIVLLVREQWRAPVPDMSPATSGRQGINESLNG